jgi:hypothetical protein
MDPIPRRPTISASLIAAVLATACGGGGSGGGSNPGTPPPPTVPPVVTTPTAVRVSQPTPFSSGCLPLPVSATLYANAEVEPHLAIDAANPNHLVAAWQQDRLSDGGARGLATAASVDGGATWSAPRPTPFSQCAGGDFARASDPWLGVSGTTVVQIGIAFTGATLTAGARSAVLVSRSADGGFTWGPVVALANDDGSQYFNDKESLTIDPTDTRYVYAVWDRLEGSDNGPSIFARSTDNGVTWSAPGIIYNPGGAGRQTIGNVVVVAPSGVLFDFFTELGPAPNGAGGTVGHLAGIRSQDKGLSWSAPGRIAELLSVGTRVPSVPQTAVRAGEVLGSFAADPRDGTLYAVWQDSRFSGGAHDSIAMSWSQDGGVTWSAPSRVNSDASVPAFTPVLSVLPDGMVGVTYYDFRQAGTSSFQPTDFWLAASRDRVTWRETRLAGNFDFRNAPDASGLFVGDYHGLTGYGSTFVTLYARTNNGDTANRTDIFADRVSAPAASAATITTGGDARKMALETWTPAAQERVGRHLSEIRDARRRQWDAWLEAAGGAGPMPPK